MADAVFVLQPSYEFAVLVELFRRRELQPLRFAVAGLRFKVAPLAFFGGGKLAGHLSPRFSGHASARQRFGSTKVMRSITPYIVRVPNAGRPVSITDFSVFRIDIEPPHVFRGARSGRNVVDGQRNLDSASTDFSS